MQEAFPFPRMLVKATRITELLGATDWLTNMH